MCQQDYETLCCSSCVLSGEVRLEECERSGWKQSRGKRRLLRGPGEGRGYSLAAAASLA
jgi:muconolactone delta-isomerase